MSVSSKPQRQSSSSSLNKVKLSQGPLDPFEGVPPYAVAMAIFKLSHRDRHRPMLQVLLSKPKWIERYGEWVLPETELLPSESIDQAGARLVRRLTGVEDIEVSSVGTQPRGKVLPGVVSICLCTVSRLAERRFDAEEESEWFDVEHPPRLGGHYGEAIKAALAQLTKNIKDVARLVATPMFTVAEVHQGLTSLHKMAGLEEPIDIRHLRRIFEKADWLEPTGVTSKAGAFRPSRLYRMQDTTVV